MKSIFLIHSSQWELVKKYCFGICKKTVWGYFAEEDITYNYPYNDENYTDGNIDCFYPCFEKECLYEEERLERIKEKGRTSYLRKLKKEVS